MNSEIVKQFVKYSIILLSFITALYLLLCVDEEGFEYIYLLPLTFCVCYLFLHKAVEKIKLILFFPCFAGVAFLRYVAGPFLLCYSNDYYGKIMYAHPSIFGLHSATFLMIYELIVCTFLIYFFSKKNDGYTDNSSHLILPQSYFVYIVFIFIAAAFVFLNPSVIFFFSFGVWGMKDVELSQLSPIAQTAIMLAICAKFVLFWVLLSIIKHKHDVSTIPFVWKSCGVVITLIFGFIYYGGNRAQFLFSLITSFYLFILFFPSLKKVVVPLLLIFGTIVFTFITDQRNYFDYYSYEKGTKNKVLNTSQTITAYFGGLTNVAIGVDMATKFADKNKGAQLFKDVFLPIVGLNKIIPFEDRVTTNALYNYVFFNSNKNVSQILPSIAHGYFYGGFVFCILFDVIQLFFVFLLASLLKKTCRMELVFVFNIILLRFSILLGQNITQQINGIAMQLMLPICVFWLNNRLTFTRKV